MALRWYVVHTYTGQESKVFGYLNDIVVSGEFGEQIKTVLMPTRNVMQIKNGKKVQTTRKDYPSYVLVEMELTPETMHAVQNTAGVTGFLGGNERGDKRGDKKPQPIREEEARRILGQALDRGSRQQVSEVPFEVGDAVKIKEGPFKDFDGVVDEVHAEKGKVKVMVSVFGRSTPVEVDFGHVAPIN